MFHTFISEVTRLRGGLCKKRFINNYSIKWVQLCKYFPKQSKQLPQYVIGHAWEPSGSNVAEFHSSYPSNCHPNKSEIY